ncbi:ORF55 [Human gammaherpesvirus 8]|uniref:Tegument protein ORF55 n=3 Tax=Human herpesvirus 8 TaxID=37296 RepID=TEG7_HHV8P|nr:ORF55 [Human gammaherpesvirus 8]F5H9W9.1 RecName: Full=Tegument protein ORF55 [Human herpesvirus 8 strain GK18]AAC57137.1 ORF 55 [Human herpesvirus 8 type M]ANI86100.1 ORF55 [synthetic construct]AAB62649.1 ORF 55 [Human gammaherpesvirus 8]ABD28906.1 ORF55 [Human gammaherpesvirus 8]ACY00454.1 ORF55 [Human gammaherpesvirus 8]
MSSPWYTWTCCGINLFGRGNHAYKRLGDPLEGCPERWRQEIDLGLPPGVCLGDVVQSNLGTTALHQTYLLAVQSNKITDYLKRFDVAKIPAGCQETVKTQVKKLQSIQNVVWNTMLALAVGEITVDDSALQSLLNKRAGECVSLMEMEKLATAMASDDSVIWASEISHSLSEPTSVLPLTPAVTRQPEATLPKPPTEDPSVSAMHSSIPPRPSSTLEETTESAIGST